jgi:hypothetical protein
MILLFFAPFAQPCCFAPFVSKWYSTPLGEEGVEELSKYMFSFVGVEYIYRIWVPICTLELFASDHKCSAQAIFVKV